METPRLYAELEKFVAGKLSPLTDKSERNRENRTIAAEFNAQTAKRFHPLSSKDALDALTSAELATLRASANPDAQAVLMYLGAGLGIDVEPGTAGRQRLNAMDADPELKPIVTAWKKAADEQYPLWQKLGCEQEANGGHVAWIRKQAEKALRQEARANV
jgi:hypothetical protein